jgi:hypothetical protein
MKLELILTHHDIPIKNTEIFDPSKTYLKTKLLVLLAPISP